MKVAVNRYAQYWSSETDAAKWNWAIRMLLTLHTSTQSTASCPSGSDRRGCYYVSDSVEQRAVSKLHFIFAEKSAGCMLVSTGIKCSLTERKKCFTWVLSMCERILALTPCMDGELDGDVPAVTASGPNRMWLHDMICRTQKFCEYLHLFQEKVRWWPAWFSTWNAWSGHTALLARRLFSWRPHAAADALSSLGTIKMLVLQYMGPQTVLFSQ